MPTPASFELPRLREKPHDRRLDNLRPGLGRVRGVQNKICRDLKVGLLDAAIAHGADGQGAGGLQGYLFMLAAEHKKTFAHLLAKLLPLQLTSDGAIGGVSVSLNVTSVPSGSYLTEESIERLRQPLQLDHAPVEQSEPEQFDDIAGNDRHEPEPDR